VDKELERAIPVLGDDVDEMVWGQNAENALKGFEDMDWEGARNGFVVLTLNDLIPLGRLDEWKSLK